MEYLGVGALDCGLNYTKGRVSELKLKVRLKETTGGEFRVYRASIRLLYRYIDLL